MKIEEVINITKNILFPKFITCISCGKELINEKEREFSLCKECYEKMKFIGEKIHNIENESLYFKYHLALFSYEDISRKLILHFKDNNNPYLGYYLSNFLYFYYQKNIDKHFDCISFVPSSKKKTRFRGYDPMKIVADEFSKSTKIKLANVLGRKNKSVDQTQSKERYENIKNSFFVVEDKINIIKDKVIVLLDDVVTTGATAKECSKLLIENGAKEVFLYTFAEAKSFRDYKDKNIKRMELHRVDKYENN